MLKYLGVLIAAEDVAVSRRFYGSIDPLGMTR